MKGGMEIWFALSLFVLYLLSCRVLRFELLPVKLRTLPELLAYWALAELPFGLFMHGTSANPWSDAALFVAPLAALMAYALNDSMPPRHWPLE